MIKVEFVSAICAKNAVAEHVIYPFRDTLIIDPQRIAGLDFYSIESRKCSFSFRITDWVQDNVMNWNFVSGTKINEYAIRVKNDSTTKFIGFIKPENNSINYNKKNKIVKITSMDVMGLLITLSGVTNSYASGEYDAIDLLGDEVQSILEKFDLSYTNNADNITYEIDSFEIEYNNKEEFDDSELTDTVVGDPSPLYDAWAYIRSVVYDAENDIFNIDICDYTQSFIEQGEYQEDIKYIHFELNTNLIVNNYKYRVKSDRTMNPLTLWDEWVDDYGVDTSNQSDEDGSGNTFSFDDSPHTTSLLYSGNLTTEEITISPDGDSQYREINRLSLINSLLILLNAAIYGEDDSDIAIIEKTNISQQPDIILDAYVMDQDEGLILHSEKQFDNYFSIFANSKYISAAIKQYFDNLFEAFIKEIVVIIKEDGRNYHVGVLVSLENITYIVSEVDAQVGEHYKQLKIWGE